jgi:uncharacterized membrane protein YczE
LRSGLDGGVARGVVVLACGVGLSVMLATLEHKPGTWTVGLVPLLIGLVLVGAGFFMRPRSL